MFVLLITNITIVNLHINAHFWLRILHNIGNHDDCYHIAVPFEKYILKQFYNICSRYLFEIDVWSRLSYNRVKKSKL